MPIAFIGYTLVIPRSDSTCGSRGSADAEAAGRGAEAEGGGVSKPGGEAMARRAGEVLQAQNLVRARLAPTGKDLEKLLMRLHRQSAKAQQKARESHAKVRAELYKRLDEGNARDSRQRIVVSTVPTAI